MALRASVEASREIRSPAASMQLRRVCFLVDVPSKESAETEKVLRMMLYVLQHLKSEFGLRSWGYRFFDSNTGGCFSSTSWQTFQPVALKEFIKEFKSRINNRSRLRTPTISRLKNLSAAIAGAYTDFEHTRSSNGLSSPARRVSQKTDKPIFFIVSACPWSLQEYVSRQRSSLAENAAIARHMKQSRTPLSQFRDALRNGLKRKSLALFWIDSRFEHLEVAASFDVSDNADPVGSSAQIDSVLQASFCGCLIPAAPVLRLLDSNVVPRNTTMHSIIGARIEAFLNSTTSASGSSTPTERASNCDDPCWWQGDLVVPAEQPTDGHNNACSASPLPTSLPPLSNDQVQLEAKTPPARRRSKRLSKSVCEEIDELTPINVRPRQWQEVGGIRVLPCNRQHTSNEARDAQMRTTDGNSRMRVVGYLEIAAALHVPTEDSNTFFVVSTPSNSSNSATNKIDRTTDFVYGLTARQQVAIVSFEHSSRTEHGLLFPWVIGCSVLKLISGTSSTRQRVPGPCRVRAFARRNDVGDQHSHQSHALGRQDHSELGEEDELSSQSSTLSDGTELQMGQSPSPPSIERNAAENATASRRSVPTCSQLIAPGTPLVALCTSRLLRIPRLEQSTTNLHKGNTSSPSVRCRQSEQLRRFLDNAVSLEVLLKADGASAGDNSESCASQQLQHGSRLSPLQQDLSTRTPPCKPHVLSSKIFSQMDTSSPLDHEQLPATPKSLVTVQPALPPSDTQNSAQLQTPNSSHAKVTRSLRQEFESNLASMMPLDGFVTMCRRVAVSSSDARRTSLQGVLRGLMIPVSKLGSVATTTAATTEAEDSRSLMWSKTCHALKLQLVLLLESECIAPRSTDRSPYTSDCSALQSVDVVLMEQRPQGSGSKKRKKTRKCPGLSSPKRVPLIDERKISVKLHASSPCTIGRIREGECVFKQMFSPPQSDERSSTSSRIGVDVQTVSDSHLELYLQSTASSMTANSQPRVMVRDLKSTNGSSLNGQQLQSADEPCEIKVGDTLCLDTLRLKVQSVHGTQPDVDVSDDDSTTKNQVRLNPRDKLSGDLKRDVKKLVEMISLVLSSKGAVETFLKSITRLYADTLPKVVRYLFKTVDFEHALPPSLQTKRTAARRPGSASGSHNHLTPLSRSLSSNSLLTPTTRVKRKKDYSTNQVGATKAQSKVGTAPKSAKHATEANQAPIAKRSRLTRSWSDPVLPSATNSARSSSPHERVSATRGAGVPRRFGYHERAFLHTVNVPRSSSSRNTKYAGSGRRRSSSASFRTSPDFPGFQNSTHSRASNFVPATPSQGPSDQHHSALVQPRAVAARTGHNFPPQTSVVPDTPLQKQMGRGQYSPGEDDVFKYPPSYVVQESPNIDGNFDVDSSQPHGGSGAPSIGDEMLAALLAPRAQQGSGAIRSSFRRRPLFSDLNQD